MRRFSGDPLLSERAIRCWYETSSFYSSIGRKLRRNSAGKQPVSLYQYIFLVSGHYLVFYDRKREEAAAG